MPAPGALEAGRLPTGRAGQALALVLLALVLALAWAAAGAPLVAWYHDRAATLDGRRTLARRMQQVAATLPELQRQAAAAAAAAAGAPVAVPVLEGATDAVAGAQLQQAVQAMAASAGSQLSSAELLPGEAAGAYRRIGLRIALSAPWPVLMRLLDATQRAQPAMVVDDLQVRGGRGFIRDGNAPLDATWTVFAFRPANPS